MPDAQDVSGEIARSCLLSRVRKLNRVVTKIYEDAMRDLGISAAQMTILVMVNELKVARPSDISHVLDIELSTLTRNLRRMLDHGWLKKVDSPDARTHPLQITRSGQQLLVKAHPLWKQAQRKANKLMGKTMARELHAVAAPNPLP